MSGKPKGPPTKSVIVRIPESLLAELSLLRSDQLMNSQHQMKYGAFSRYIQGLIRRDLDTHTDEIRRMNSGG